ncbi:MAG: POTRA domain-containing protein [Paludibacter sp.]|nr:POTRA domain-containing protein [Paludibacter sp.]MDD4427366.1 POTRA domain-containing protein [Paludibacter sp.]
MFQRYFFLIVLFSLFFHKTTFAQQNESADTLTTPEINYGSIPQKYEIAEITVSGADNYEDFVLIGFSGLSVGDVITVPGDAISEVVKRFWKQGLFSDVKVYATKIENEKIWLNIALKQRPQVSKINYHGLKKGEIDELSTRLGIVEGNQITPNISDRAILVIKKYLEEKGFMNVETNVYQRNDPEKSNHVIVDIEVDKKIKSRVKEIIIEGNHALTFNQINRTMKKTNDGNWRNFFRTKKFVREEYEKDKISLIEKYNEIGYRDAYIVSDSVIPIDEKHVRVYLTIDEGKKYYFRDIKWVGNTIYPYEYLSEVLNIKKGDVYNYKELMKRLQTDENEAVSKLYQDRGYLFSHIEPVEVMIENDSIDFEMRIYEGKQATINAINIKGNTRVYEHVVRRELYTKPGQLYSQSDIMRTYRELAGMGHFDPEKIKPDIQPDPENGTVDITYELETKGSDQIEFSAGWGATGIVGTLGLKFTNFAIQNLFKPETYRIVPQGEGQTFSINARTNGQSYSSVSASFLEPWLGGKRPNSLSASIYYASQTGVSKRFYESMQNYMYSPYGYGGYGGYGNYENYGGYGGNDAYTNMYKNEMDPGIYMRTLGASIGYGKRLNWPDDYFSFYGELSFQRFMLSNWAYLPPLTDGNFNNFSLNLSLSRNSIFNPIYTRRGSSFSLGLKITPPYSTLNGKDYADKNMSDQERYKFIEYHKWTLNGKTFTPLTMDEKLILMTRMMFGYLGHYNKNARSPYETYYMGGDGMSAYTSYGTEYIAMRGYESGSLVPLDYERETRIGYLYNKFTMELRYPLSLEQSATIYVLGFLEAGNSFNKISKYNPFDLKRAAGVGVRIFLPMFGMMGIDWGYGFDRNTTGAISGSQLHFVLGQEL